MGTDTSTFEPLVDALLTCAFQSERARAWCARWRWGLVVAGAAGVVVGVALLGRGSDVRQAYFFGGAVGFSVACAALIAAIESGRSILQPVLGWWSLAKLGVISYAVYLWFWPLSVWILRPFRSEEAERLGWHVYDAAEGIPGAVTTREGEMFVHGDRYVATVPKAQREAIEKHRPALVVWWSRYDATHRRQPSGRLLVAGTPELWQAGVADVRAAIDRLTVGGARVLFVEQDRPGKGMLGRCTPGNCHWFLAHHDLAERLNALMREIARADRRVIVTPIDDVLCRDEAVPFDDSLDAGGFARPEARTSPTPPGPSSPELCSTALGLADVAERGAHR